MRVTLALFFMIMMVPTQSLSVNNSDLQTTEKSLSSIVGAINISSPQNEQTVHDPVSVTVNFSLPDNLPIKQVGSINLLVDGSVVLKMTHGSRFVISYPDRGTHTLQVEALDKSGNVVAQSASLIIYVQRAHVKRLLK